MTYFQIGFPDVNGRAQAITPSDAYDSDYPQYNLLSKERYQVAKLASAVAVGTHYVEYDLGSGVTSSCDFLYIARADLLKAALVTQVRLYGSNGAYSAVYTDAGFASATLYGPRSQDYIATFATTTAYRKWKCDYTYSGSTVLPRSKEWYGTMFDMGKSPIQVEVEDVGNSGGLFTASSGAEYFTRTEEPAYRFHATWHGVTDAKIIYFFDNILKYQSTRPVFLYTSGYHNLLDEKRLVMCRIVGEPRSRKVKNDWNEIEVSFEEILG